MERDKFPKQPIGDIEWIRNLVKFYKENPCFTKEGFFSHALLGFYDGWWAHMTRDAGHVIYRLSDFVPKEERKRMQIYPGGPEGSIVWHEIDDDGEMEEVRWNSLEDFRREWERLHPIGIPQYVRQLPPGIDLERNQPKE